MILLYEVAKSGPFTTVYKDSDDPNLFYFAPEFAELRKLPNGRLMFGSTLFKKDPTLPEDGFSLYNFGIRTVVPNSVLTTTLTELRRQYGPNVSLSAVPGQNLTLTPLTQGIYKNIECQSNGANIHSDLACSFRVPEDLEPTMANFFQKALGWTGAINYRVRTRKTSFKWKITANWKLIQDHFRAQVSVKYWFVKANLSYETQKLITEDKLRIDIVGGTPSQREKIYTFAEKIAARMFVKTLEISPLPDHPSGAAVCFSLNYARIEEDRVSIWEGEESDFEDREMSAAVYVRDVPGEYFVGFDSSAPRIPQPLPSYPPGFFEGLVIPDKFLAKK